MKKYKPRIHTSASQEALLELFLEHLAHGEGKPANPFTPEKVVVQSFGMAKWLRLAVARHAGVCANIDFPFPVSFARGICNDIFGHDDLSHRKEFRDSSMLWHIYQELPRCVKDDKSGAFAGVGRYLLGDRPGLRRYELATRIADVFDNYLFYRPDWINAWDNGEPVETGGSARDAAWQKKLWLRICGSLRGTVDEGLMHPAGVFAGVEAEMKKLRARGELATRLPARVAVFGISYLPPVLSEFFLTLGLYTQVDFYLYSPAAGPFWGNIGLRRPAGLLLKEPTFSVNNERFPETGHPLLDGCGIMGRQFLNTMLSAEQGKHCPVAAPKSAAGSSMLDRLKASVVNGLSIDGKTAVAEDDTSISFHTVHTPMREMEVVRDQILDAFDADPDLTPDQVLVLVPDVEQYTPYIDAVFGTGAGPRIPYAVADRVYRKRSSLLGGFLQLLAEAEGRFAASRMLGLLEYPAIRRTFGISGDELEACADLVAAGRIRWGRDAADREREGLPAFGNNTWQKGLDRLFLGYMAGDDEADVAGLQPVAVAAPDLTGRLASFFYTVSGRIRTLREAVGSPIYWQQHLQSLAAACLTPDDDEIGELNELQAILEELGKVYREEAITEECGLDVMRAHLEKNLDTCSTAHGFIDGGVTFCSFKPMRSIPFRMVVLAGMGIREFPRKTPSAGFDLADADPRQGDRSVREDDRYLFLEMVLSARNRLVITYQGRSPYDDSEIAPSVVVTELADLLDSLFVPPAGCSAGNMGVYLTRQHHLMACHPAYYTETDARFFSYNDAYAPASRLVGQGDAVLDGIAARPGMEQDTDPVMSVSPQDLALFWQHPARYYIRNCLNAVLVRGEDAGDDAEPFAVAGLGAYGMGSAFVDACLAGNEPDVEGALRSDDVPPGEPGRQMVHELAGRAREFAGSLQRFYLREQLDLNIKSSFELFCSECVAVDGNVRFYDGAGMLFHRFATIKDKDRTQAWVYHLLLNVAGAHLSEASRYTTVAGKGGAPFVLQPLSLETARVHLVKLLTWFRAGQRAPLPFTPDTSMAYANRIRILQDKGDAGPGIRAAAAASARAAWDNTFAAFSESADPFYTQCFMANLPADTDTYDIIARDICLPLLETGVKRKAGAKK